MRFHRSKAGRSKFDHDSAVRLLPIAVDVLKEQVAWVGGTDCARPAFLCCRSGAVQQGGCCAKGVSPRPHLRLRRLSSNKDPRSCTTKPCCVGRLREDQSAGYCQQHRDGNGQAAIHVSCPGLRRTWLDSVQASLDNPKRTCRDDVTVKLRFCTRCDSILTAIFRSLRFFAHCDFSLTAIFEAKTSVIGRVRYVCATSAIASLSTERMFASDWSRSM